jgi:hypothetical protein
MYRLMEDRRISDLGEILYFYITLHGNENEFYAFV